MNKNANLLEGVLPQSTQTLRCPWDWHHVDILKYSRRALEIGYIHDVKPSQLTGIFLKCVAQAVRGSGRPSTFPVTENRNAEGSVTTEEFNQVFGHNNEAQASTNRTIEAALNP